MQGWSLGFPVWYEQEIMHVVVIHPGGCLEVSSVCRVFQPEDARSSSACVCDCGGELMGVAQELRDVSSCQHGRDRVGLRKGAV